MENIYLVEELRINSMENNYNDACYYEPIGYIVESELYKIPDIDNHGTGWPIAKGKSMKDFIVKKLEHIKFGEKNETKD